MAVFKCKMCGGSLEVLENQTVVECEYCATKQTLPRLNDDRKMNLYDRANHFRRNNEFDKATAIYEQILNENPTDAESYWSIVLCRYGIEYVEDPASGKRIPTVNRAQFTSVFDDEDYRSALKHADPAQKAVYESEAAAINEIQKGILAISQKEEPFDVFICYKESDENGRRTPDSVLANDLYHQLTQEGFKVFFARITLEDKLGTAYEPYIFAALHSAKVMVVLGTKPEYFTAVWVRNEWSRYLALVKSGEKKMLIPAYKDMDPYDLPAEFSHLQAQDMSKLGFMQDLIRGIKKIVEIDKPKPVEVTAATVGSSSLASYLKRAFLFMEDGDWEAADEYCEKVLDIDPECAMAYVGKLMVALTVHRQEELGTHYEPIEDHFFYQKAYRFGDDAVRKMLENYNKQIAEHLEFERQLGIYNEGVNTMDYAPRWALDQQEAAFMNAAYYFDSIPGFQDADDLAAICRENAEESRKKTVYDNAVQTCRYLTKDAYKEAGEMFQSISGWQDADEKVVWCEEQIALINRREEEERQRELRKKKVTRIVWLVILGIALVVAVVIVYRQTVLVPKQKYETAVTLVEQGQFQKAYDMVSKDSDRELLAKQMYDISRKLFDDGNYEKAYEGFTLGGANDMAQKCLYNIQQKQFANVEVGDTISFGEYDLNANAADGDEAMQWDVIAIDNGKMLLLSSYIVETMPFDEGGEGLWADSTLRMWMNDFFLNDVFSTYHQQNVITMNIGPASNTEYGITVANGTEDKLFLLSEEELGWYHDLDKLSNRTCTQYNDQYTEQPWWLRTPGSHTYTVSYVNSEGYVNNLGYDADVDIGVRPAVWISIPSGPVQ